MRRWAWRLVGVVAMLAAHAGLARWCDRAGLVERLLAPGGAGAWAAVVAAVGLFVLRLGLVFVVPGWLLSRGVLELRRGARRPTQPKTPARPNA